MTQTITAYFDTRTQAQAAVDRLAHLGIAGGNVALHDGTASAGEPAHKGFLASLADFLMGDEDRDTYAEGVRRGGSVVTVSCPEIQFDAVSDILEAEGAADLDEKASSWEADGWNRPTDYAIGSIERLNALSGVRPRHSSSSEGSRPVPQDMRGNMLGTDHPDTDAAPRLGTRDVSHGRARVRSYIADVSGRGEVSSREATVDILSPSMGCGDERADVAVDRKDALKPADVRRESHHEA